MALSENNLSTTTLQFIRKRMADNIFKANPLAAWLLMNGRVETISGGKRIDIPLIYTTNNTVQAYRGYDRLNVNPTEELTNAQFSWRQLAGTVSLSGLEYEVENSGEQAIFDLLKAKTRILEMSLKQFLAQKLLNNTATKDLSRDFLGLDELIEDNAVALQSTVGGINRAVETWWANVITDNFATPLGASTVLLNQFMMTLYNSVSIGLNQPDLLITDQVLFERYENDNRGFLVLYDTKLLDVGFQNFRFKGATLMWDQNMPTGTTAAPLSGGGIGNANAGATSHLIYAITSDYMQMVLHPKRNFVMTPFVKPYDQDAQVAQLLVAGNLVISNSRFQGVSHIKT